MSSSLVHRQSQNPATNIHDGAEVGVQTLRQAYYQEIPGSAMCVQKFDDSRGLAIRTTYRISRRSSSVWEPRHPLPKVISLVTRTKIISPFDIMNLILG